MMGGSFCEYSGCEVSLDELPIKCLICGENVFCSEQCRMLGTIEHTTKMGCEQKKLYTPRSVLFDVLSEIKRSTTARNLLWEKYKKGQDEKGLGLLLLWVKDMNNICEMINFSVRRDFGATLAEMATYEKITDVDESLRLRRGEIICDGSSSFVLAIKSLQQGSIIFQLPS